MTHVFDGMGPLIRDVFGGSVTVTPSGGAARSIRAVFREAELIVMESEGMEVTTLAPVLTLAKGEAADLVPGGTCAPGDGRSYRIIGYVRRGTPAADGNVALQLERLDGRG